MFRRTFIATALVFALAGSNASAGSDSDLSAAEIEALLGGNTISGNWNGSDYKQYYGPDGFTIYIPASGSNDEGKWRVNTGENTYESWWSATGWTTYKVEARGRRLRLDRQTRATAYPFVVLQGQAGYLVACLYVHRVADQRAGRAVDAAAVERHFVDRGS